MKKPLSGELLQNNLVEKKAHIRHPRNTANTSTFGLLDAKNLVKHAYFEAGSVSVASSPKSEQQENTVNYMVLACCARNYPPPPPHPPANPNPESGTPSTAAKSSKAKNNSSIRLQFNAWVKDLGFWPITHNGYSANYRHVYIPIYIYVLGEDALLYGRIGLKR